jgi:DEAD/DEAH box helicase domain-containing protein
MESQTPHLRPPADGPVVVFDVETQNLFEDVGGQRQAHKLLVSIAVSYDADADVFRSFREENVSELIDQLFSARLVVGYNTIKFDYAVLRAYTKQRFNRVPTLDLFDHLYRRTGYRSRLDTVAAETLGTGKSGSGRDACQMWRDGRVDELIAYCQQDVQITYDLYRYGKENGAVFTRDPRGRKTRVAVMW